MPSEFITLRRTDGDGVATVVLDNPPLNLITPAMIDELGRLFADFGADESVRVVVFESANSDFFIGHADLSLFLDPRKSVPPKASASDRSVLLQFEAAVGVLPGATGSQRLPRLIGRMRALEVILGCDEIPADLAERYGLINRAFPAAELEPFVRRLARRIATFPSAAIALNKVAVDAADHLPIGLGLLEERHALNQTLVGGEAQRRMSALLDMGAQTVPFERHEFAAALDKLGA